MMRCIAGGGGGGSTYDPAAVAITGGTINGTTIGASSASSVRATTIVATSTITPSTTAGIVGTTLADSAQAGSVGQIQSLTVSAFGSFASGFLINLVDITLTPGCYMVYGSYYINPTGGAVITRFRGGLSLAGTTLPALHFVQHSGVVSTTDPVGTAVPPQIVNVSVSTHVYLIANSLYSGSVTADGNITAVRIR